MILECPACNTRYNVPDGAIGPGGRSVRCKACGHSWQAGGPVSLVKEPEPEPEAPAPQPEPEAAAPVADVHDDHAIAPEEPEPSLGSGRRWAVIAAILLLMVAAAIGALAALGPDTVRERLGFATKGSSVALLLQVPRSPERRRLASGNELFALTGRIVNPTRERQNVPDIQAELQDAQGRIVYSWIITPPTRTLAPGGSAEFNSAEVDVPKGAQELKLSFVGARS